MPACVQLPIPQDQLDDLVEKAKDYALMHGICMRRKDAYDRDALHFAPFVLFPSPFPREEFHKAVALQTTLNELMHHVAHNDDFLREALKHTSPSSPSRSLDSSTSSLDQESCGRSMR